MHSFRRTAGLASAAAGLALTVALLVPGEARAELLYSNGGLSTGATSKSGATAPFGGKWSEVQNDTGNTTESNTLGGVSAIQESNRLADDFTVPVGEIWTVESVDFYAYKTSAPVTPSPIVGYTLQVWDGAPDVAGSKVIAGDTTTNVLSKSTDTLLFRIFNTTTPPPGSAPGSTRRIWRSNAKLATPVVLPAGTYYLDWASRDSANGSHFSPTVTVVGSRGLPGWNALQYTNTIDTWEPILDDGNPTTAADVPQDLPFDIQGKRGAVCGDSVLIGGVEACDDGNTIDGDGCDSNCKKTGCGNGVPTGTETCDDGNLNDDDGCDSNCTPTGCGNGILTSGEVCEDNNTTDGDGCDSNCTATGCGNNVLTDGEACDDGNATDGDGCDSNCTATGCGNDVLTAGEACDDGNVTDGDGCDSNCTASACGNGILAGAEACDDGNISNGDGCDANCTATACGNGIVTAGELCDDGNTVGGDGCDGNCLNPGCGNGFVSDPEGCDDGNDVSGDGCDVNCTPTGCGNGVLTEGEVCEDGNTTDGDGCDSDCTPSTCGNNIKGGDEDCDDGNKVDGDGCDSNCTATACGNDVVTDGEECDDGNTNSGDGCDAECKKESVTGGSSSSSSSGGGDTTVEGGCNCSVPGETRAASGAWAALGLLGLFFVRPRRRR